MAQAHRWMRCPETLTRGFQHCCDLILFVAWDVKTGTVVIKQPRIGFYQKPKNHLITSRLKGADCEVDERT
jgi:hypothetical protein